MIKLLRAKSGHAHHRRLGFITSKKPFLLLEIYWTVTFTSTQFKQQCHYHGRIEFFCASLFIKLE